MKNKILRIVVLCCVLATLPGGGASASNVRRVTSTGSELQAVSVPCPLGIRHTVENGYPGTYGVRMLSNIYRNPNGSFVTVDENFENVVVTFWNQSFRQTAQRKIPKELSLFGGFFHGKNCNYLVFGQENQDEDDEKEVMRVVKYDGDFNRLSAATVKNCYTVLPFDAGSCRMAESGDRLIIHTARLRYRSKDDGYRHQSQLTVVIDTNSMTITNRLDAFQSNHVSHSFNQFALYDGEDAVLIDHGDGYPRGVVAHKSNGAFYRSCDLMKLSGGIGYNWTGISVGGAAQSDSRYLVTVNTVRQNAVQYAEDGFKHKIDSDERDAVLLSCDKSLTKDSVRQIQLTDYYRTGTTVGTPYLVQTGENRYVALWQEFRKGKDQWGSSVYNSQGVRYALIDGNANVITDAILAPKAKTSSYCQPVTDGDSVVWYVDENEGDCHRIFYRLSLPRADGSFSDVAPGKYYYDAVKWAVDKGITQGRTSTTFAPDAPCTRAQAVTFLWRAAGSPEPQSLSNPFRDVAEGAYYYKAALWAVEQGITNGVTSVSFQPDATVSRAQMVTFLFRSVKLPAGNGRALYADVPQGSYYYDAVTWASDAGVTKGKTSSAFAPKESCTRGQIVTFLYRKGA